MNILNKVMTAIKGGINEVGEAIVDGQALRILDQEVRETSEELNLTKGNLTAMMAKRKVSEEKVAEFNQQIKEYESYVIKALDQGDKNLAHEIAEKVAELEKRKDSEVIAEKGYANNLEQLRHSVNQSEMQIKRLRQQVDTVRATESVQRAQAAVSKRHDGSDARLQTAMDSLQRIKDKQALKASRMDAVDELAEDQVVNSLQDKLEAAGIVPGSNEAEKVLARLQEKMKPKGRTKRK